MGMFDMLMAPKTEPVVMEPFIAPDLSELSDRELIERTLMSQLRAEHMITQTMMTLSSHPVFGGMVPKL